MSFKPLIRKNASRIKELHERMHALVAGRDRDESGRAEWVAACAEFRENYDELAFPGGVATARERLRNGQAEAIEYALDFLEIRPYFFRSGYRYKDFLRVLRNCSLSEAQRRRYDKVRDDYDQYRRNRRQS